MPTWAAILLAVCGCTGGYNLISDILKHRWSKKDQKDERLEEMQRRSDERFDELKEDLDAIKEAQRASMEERIRYLVGRYHKKGVITISELSNLRDMHKRYVGIGGNGNLDTEMGILDAIPVTRKEEAP